MHKGLFWGHFVPRAYQDFFEQNPSLPLLGWAIIACNPDCLVYWCFFFSNFAMNWWSLRAGMVSDWSCGTVCDGVTVCHVVPWQKQIYICSLSPLLPLFLSIFSSYMLFLMEANIPSPKSCFWVCRANAILLPNVPLCDVLTVNIISTFSCGKSCDLTGASCLLSWNPAWRPPRSAGLNHLVRPMSPFCRCENGGQ